MHIEYTLSYVASPPDPLAPLTDTKPPCDEDGSIIGVQNQSLGEVLPIAGTPFNLRYQSERMPGRVGKSGWTARNFYLGGWGLDVLHAYDTASKVLYLGNGTTRSGADVQPTSSGSDLLIPDQDENLVYRFDKNGRHIETLDEFTGAAVYRFAYDSQGRVTGITDAAGNQMRVGRTGDQPTEIVGPYGHRTALAADSNGYLNQIQAPDGAITRLTYDANGMMSALTGPRGNVHRFSFGADGRLLRDEDPAGGFKVLARSDQGNVSTVTVTTASARVTSYSTTDSAGTQNLQTVFPDGSKGQATMAGGLFQSARQNSGMLTTIDWAADPRWGMQAATPKRIAWTTPAGLSGAMSLDRKVDAPSPSNPAAFGGLHETIQLDGRTWHNDYDAGKRILRFVTPAARQFTRRLDELGRVAEEQWGKLAPRLFTYDRQGRLTGISEGSGSEARVRTFEYGSDGLVSRSTDALGQVTGMEYDKAGRLARTTFPGGGTAAWSYDAAGNLISTTPPGGKPHTFKFTPMDLVSAYTPPGAAQPLSFTWNSDGELSQITRHDGGVVRANRDAAGHIDSLEFPSGRFDYTYDAATGQLTGVADQEGNSLAYGYDGDLLISEQWTGVANGSVAWTYDTNLRPESVSVNASEPVLFTYDDDGYLTGAGALAISRDPDNALVVGTALDQVSETRGYNSFGELLRSHAEGPGGALLDIQYSRDKLGRVTEKVETASGGTTTWRYGYDAAGRLTIVDRDGAAFARYAYDLNGNRTRVTSGSGSEDATYDDQDRLASRGPATYSYTANGELLEANAVGQKTHYEYDALGGLRRVVLPDGREIRYTMDGLGRRIGRFAGGVFDRAFVYLDEARPAAELDSAGNVVSLFVYTSGSAPAYLVKNGVRYRVLRDQVGSVRLVVDAATGDIVQRMDYDAFGNVILDTNPGFQPFGFAGGLYDPDTGLVRFGARDYDPPAGRWTTRDPIGFAGGDTNLYAYVGDDPVNRTDASGLEPSADPWAQLYQNNVPDPLAPLVDPWDKLYHPPPPPKPAPSDKGKATRKTGDGACRDADCSKKTKKPKAKTRPPQKPLVDDLHPSPYEDENPSARNLQPSPYRNTKPVDDSDLHPSPY